MKLNSVLLLIFLFLFVFFKDGYSQDEELSSSSSSDMDNSFCIGKSERECMSANACCVWCEGILPNSTSTPTPTASPTAAPTTASPSPKGYCHYAQEFTECPKDMIFAVCKNYNITKCTCNFRNAAPSQPTSITITTIIVIIISIIFIIY